MKLYRRITIGGLTTALSGLLCVGGYAMVTKAEEQTKSILTIPTGAYGTRAIAAGDSDQDGLVEFLIPEVNGEVYVYEKVDGKYVKTGEAIFKIP